MKRIVLSLFLVFFFVSAACSLNFNIPRMSTGDVQKLIINEPELEIDSMSPADIRIGMGGGNLNITPGANGLLDGTIRYNLPLLNPTIERKNGKLSLEQNGERITALPSKNWINDWSLRLGKSPTDLSINAGAYEGTLDLSGISLTNLDISDGASKVKVMFNQPNPVKMDHLSYHTGASQVVMEGLANANFSSMSFEGGAGSYSFDFSGSLHSTANVTIRGGVGDFKIIIPKGMKSQISVEGGLNNVNVRGAWTVHEDNYETEGSGPLLKIKTETGIGNLQLINK